MENEINLAITPQQYQSLPPDSRAALLSQLQKYYPQQAARLAGSTTAPTPPAVLSHGSSTQGGSDAPPVPSYSPTAGVSPEQKADAIQNLVAKGIVSAEDAAALARAEGIAPTLVKIEAPAPPAQPLTLEQANAKLAATSDPLAPSTSPSDYGAFHFDPEHVADMPPDELTALNSVFADGLHEGQFPRQLGQALVNQMMRSANRFADLGDAERQLAFQSEGARLRCLGNINQIVENAEYAWSHLPERFRSFAAEHYLFHAADSYAALGHAGEQMRAREARRK